MNDQLILFLLLVLPVLVVAALTWLGIVTIGLAPIVAAFRSAPPLLKGLLVLAGIAVIFSPLLFRMAMDARGEMGADARAAELARLERVDLAGRMPTHFIVLSGQPGIETFIQQRFGLRTHPDAENRRLVEAYRAYRRAELCHRRFPGNPMMPGTRLPQCKPLPASIQTALDLRAPLLVVAEGANTSLREDNIRAGEIYEIRLITSRDDRLVAYFEERTIVDTPNVFNPYAAGRRNAATGEPPTFKAFIAESLEGVGR